MAKGFIKANDPEKHEFWKVLREVAHSTEINGVKHCVYKEGWDDEAVLTAVRAHVRPEMNVTHVARYRLAMFGVLQTAAPKKPDRDNDIWDAIDQLKRRVEYLETRVKELENQQQADAETFAQMQGKIDALQKRINVSEIYDRVKIKAT